MSEQYGQTIKQFMPFAAPHVFQFLGDIFHVNLREAPLPQQCCVFKRPGVKVLFVIS